MVSEQKKTRRKATRKVHEGANVHIGSLSEVVGPSMTHRIMVHAMTLEDKSVCCRIFGVQGTHNPPRLKTKTRPSFWPIGSWSRKILLMGKQMRITSATSVHTELLYQRAPILMQWPGIVLCHAFGMGLGRRQK